MDGTLVDSTPGLTTAWRRFGKDYGFDGDAALEATHGVRLWDSLSRWCGITDEDKLKEEAVRFEEEVINGGVNALPGVHKLLNKIREGASADLPGWTIVTSATNIYTPRALAQSKIDLPAYAKVVTANDVARGKPNPDPYLAGAKVLNVDPNKCLVVEDAVNGLLSGKAAGAYTLAVTTSTTREAVATVRPDWIVPDLTHVSARWVDGKIELTIRTQ